MRLTTTFATAAAFAAMALPASAVAAEPTPDTTPSASQQCKTLKTQMTATVFAQAYGTNANRSNAFGKCVSKLAAAQEDGTDEAKKDCKAEQAAGAAAFTAKYGTGKNGANAYGKCVSGKAKKAAAAAKAAELNAAKRCKSERAAGAAAFTAKYGTGETKRNAFGKCVAAASKAATAA